jgi:hypothetical protein
LAVVAAAIVTQQLELEILADPAAAVVLEELED